MIVILQIRTRRKAAVRRRQPPGGWAPALLALFLLVSAAGILGVWQARQRELPLDLSSAAFPSYLDRIFERRAAPPSRLIYPYSVIPGGVASAAEVVEAARRDPVVARHYAGFDASRARTVTLTQPRLAYVSYRIKDNVYFTRKPVRLFAGEQVITDGKTTIRARCGNKVEEAPQMAVSAEEPPEEVLNTPKLEAEPERAAPLAAPGLTPVTPEEETPLAAVVPPAGFAPLDIPSRGPGGIWLTPPPAIGGVVLPGSAPGPGGAPPPVPPGTPGPSIPPPSGTDPGSPPPGTPPTAPPPGTPPPGTPGTPPVSPPPDTPPPGTPGTPPISPPPGTPPPATPATPPVSPPPDTPPPGTPGTPPVSPPPSTPPTGTPTPPGGGLPPGGPLPPPVLPPPPSDPGIPPSEPPPIIVIPPPGDGAPPTGEPEPPEIPEPSTWILSGLGLLSLPVLRRWLRRGSGESSAAR